MRVSTCSIFISQNRVAIKVFAVGFVVVVAFAFGRRNQPLTFIKPDCITFEPGAF